ncbi:hypothetical protein [Streptomyces alfalfae]
MRVRTFRSKATLAVATTALLLSSATLATATADEDNPEPPIEKLTDDEGPALNISGYTATGVAPKGEMPTEEKTGEPLSSEGSDTESPEPPIEKLTDDEGPALNISGYTATGVAPKGEIPTEEVVSLRPEGPNFHMYTDDGAHGGYVEFYPRGDYVGLTDRTGDGRSVEIDVWNETKDPDKYEFGFVERRGDNHTTYSDASMGQPYNMAERHCFKFRIRLVDNGSVVPGTTDYAQWRNYNENGGNQNCDDVE